MKIRTGFVSNSSSASYLIIVKKEDFQKIYNGLKDFEQSMINEVSKPFKKFGMNLVEIYFKRDEDYTTLDDWEESNKDDFTQKQNYLFEEKYYGVGRYFEDKVIKNFESVENITHCDFE